MQKIARIAYNSADWHHPTGEAAQHELKGSYNNVNRFGHEEWLFRNDWQIDGWRYAFLQGVNKSRAKLVKEKKPFDVTLFTIEPNGRRRFVAQIEDAESLDDIQAADALEAFRANGWLETMKAEIRAVGGTVEALGDPQWADQILNIRFRLEKVRPYPRETFAPKDSPIVKRNRYNLMDMDRLRSKIASRNLHEGSIDLPNAEDYLRAPVEPVRVSPEHSRMQALLMTELRAEYPECLVLREKHFIDVTVETASELRLYEIKSDLDPRTVIRLAIGQLLEYAYFQVDAGDRKVVLIAVGRHRLSQEDSEYLAHLRKTIGYTFEYRTVNI